MDLARCVGHDEQPNGFEGGIFISGITASKPYGHGSPAVNVYELGVLMHDDLLGNEVVLIRSLRDLTQFRLPPFMDAQKYVLFALTLAKTLLFFRLSVCLLVIQKLDFCSSPIASSSATHATSRVSA